MRKTREGKRWEFSAPETILRSRQDFMKRISGSSQNFWEIRELNLVGQEYGKFGTTRIELNHTTESVQGKLASMPLLTSDMVFMLLLLSLLLLSPNLEVISAAAATHNHTDHLLCLLLDAISREGACIWLAEPGSHVHAYLQRVWEMSKNCQPLSPIKIHEVGDSYNGKGVQTMDSQIMAKPTL